MAAGNVGLAVWTQLRTINAGEPRADRRRSPTSPVGEHATCSATRPTTTRRSSSASPTREVVAFSQKCTHLGCVVYYEADEGRWHCPCHEGNFDGRHRRGPLRAAARDRSGASTSRSRDGTVWALGARPEDDGNRAP